MGWGQVLGGAAGFFLGGPAGAAAGAALGGGLDEAELLASCYRNSLKLAVASGARWWSPK